MAASSKALRQSKQAVGLRHIAEELNISVSLVSKVLSGRLGTSGANVDRIRAIHEKARQLDYRKNLLAEALRTGRQNAFAVFIHRHGAPGSPIVDEMVDGIASAASGHQQRLLMHYYRNAGEFRQFAPLVHRNSVDGIIVAGLSHTDLVADLKEIHGRGVPVLTIHDEQVDPQFTNVGIDQSEITRRATLHLIDQGCKSIAHFRVHDRNAKDLGLREALVLPEDRYQGYVKALTERGIELRPELIIDVANFYHEDGVLAVRRLVESGVHFDGIVAQCDQHAVAALNYLIEIGRKVPRDVKVIGVDNAPFCQFAIVPLSSVSQQFAQRGTRAVELMTRKLSGEEVPSVQVDPVLCVRASSSSDARGARR